MYPHDGIRNALQRLDKHDHQPQIFLYKEGLDEARMK